MNKTVSNKKLIITGILAALCLACFAGIISISINNADAKNSPVAPAYQNGFTFYVNDYGPDGTYLDLHATNKQASNVPSDLTPCANFEILSNRKVDFLSISVSYENAAAVAGQPMKIYLQHDNGATEVLESTFSNAGVVSFTINDLSVFSIWTKFNENVNPISPKTGIYA